MTMTITSIAGSGKRGYSGDGGPAWKADMDNPFHVEIDREGHFLYFADCFNFRIRRVDLHRLIVENFAGTGNQGHSGDGGPATEADIDEIYAIQMDMNGGLYLCQRFNPAIRKIDGNTGTITTIAGTGIPGSGEDGIPGTQSLLLEPNDCALDGKGGLLIADVQDQKIRLLDLDSEIITTFAGTGKLEHTGDGGHALEAGIFGARAVCTDHLGNTFICERGGNTLRRVDRDGIITTIAGTGDKGYSGDGGPAVSATLNGPKAIRCDLQGNVLIVDTENHAIRLVEVSSGIISTIAGGRKGPDGDDGDAMKSGMARPHGAVAGPNGELYVADSENQRIRLIQ
ncbi:MAG: hypothetical protein FI713_07595 [SAR202 cluster bacterium]|nr:hypothetical protein [SAR202 cluster bacterium]